VTGLDDLNRATNELRRLNFSKAAEAKGEGKEGQVKSRGTVCRGCSGLKEVDKVPQGCKMC
jgi:hypothetical protein